MEKSLKKWIKIIKNTNKRIFYETKIGLNLHNKNYFFWKKNNKINNKIFNFFKIKIK